MNENLRKFPDYALYSPPADLADRGPREWSAIEAKRYFDWFVEAIPSRCAALKEVAGTLGGQLDGSPESLRPLGRWLSSAIIVHKKSEAQLEGELRAMSDRAREMGIDDWTLSSESLSLCVDIGIYLGEVLRNSCPGLRWSLCTRPKSDVSYNQPVLQSGTMKVDPVHLVVVLGYGIARGNRDADDLFGIYEAWVDRIAK